MGLLDANGRPIASAAAIDAELERMNANMEAVRGFLEGKEYSDADVLNIAMNLLVQTVINAGEQDVGSIRRRCVQAMKMLDAGLGSALQSKAIEDKIRASLEIANTPNKAS